MSDHTALDAFWMPFTANRQFKATPRLLTSASGMFYRSDDGRQVLDGTAGLWCCNAGHAHPRIVEAVQKQVATLDFAPTFQMGHPTVFALAERLAAIAPDPLNHVFFANSGSESVDTALKIALAYHRIRGEGQRTRLIGREKGYHGVGFGGISVGGMVNNRKMFGPLLPGVDHLRHTLDIPRNAFSRGLPKHGLELVEDLERLVQLHDASTIAAVIVEPIACSGGVVMPPEGYLQRLRRVGGAFGAQRFGVVPDLITTAKGLTNGTIPMGAVLVADHIHDTFMHGPDGAIELFHGYTYSGHPVACAAALAALDVYAEENLFEKAITLGEYWENALHSLKGLANVIDIRNFGLIGAIELAPRDNAPGTRGYEVFTRCFHDLDLMVRCSGDVIALSPPLILEKEHIDRIAQALAQAIAKTA
ncbi:MAG: aspartate aminotransferase family protein [Gammaproteobacteria bacterium HGW-Gammaproteobacteria-4]|nr:MAG: aspartate aminotransferase family protein [Gammaproteobacteria bacterium HGW-Gammaproteobacteria-4]